MSALSREPEYQKGKFPSHPFSKFKELVHFLELPSSTQFPPHRGAPPLPGSCQVSMRWPWGLGSLWRGKGFDVRLLLSNLLTSATASISSPQVCAEQGFFVDSEITFENNSGEGDTKPSVIKNPGTECRTLPLAGLCEFCWGWRPEVEIPDFGDSSHITFRLCTGTT